MARVEVSVDFGTTINEGGYDVAVTEVTCGRCGHKTESYGDSQRSVDRCKVLLNRQCPLGQQNFYVE